MKNLRNYLCLTVLIFVSVMAMAQEDKLTVTGRNITTKQAFEQIEAQSKYTIAYNVSKFNADRKVSVNLKNKPLKSVLIAILKGSGNYSGLFSSKSKKASKRSYLLKCI